MKEVYFRYRNFCRKGEWGRGAVLNTNFEGESISAGTMWLVNAVFKHSSLYFPKIEESQKNVHSRYTKCDTISYFSMP